MGSTEHWDHAISCPQCRAHGTAQVTELDGWAFMRALENGDAVRWIEPPKGFELNKPPHPNANIADLIKRGILRDHTNDNIDQIICSTCKIPAKTEK